MLENPAPTEAEQNLVVAGLRADDYLCFFGLHVLTPGIMETLGRQLEPAPADLSLALSELARSQRYLPTSPTSCLAAATAYDPFPEPRSLAERMVAFRRLRGLRTVEAAGVAGVDPSTWSSCETSAAPISAGCR